MLSVPPLSKTERLTHLNGRGQSSLFYELKESSYKKVEAWIIDIIKENIQACFKAQTQSVNTKFKHMYPDVPDICVKCREAKGKLIHCLWKCSKIHQFCITLYMFTGNIPGEQQSPLIDFGLLQLCLLMEFLFLSDWGKIYSCH